jgi:hypothetical protein
MGQYLPIRRWSKPFSINLNHKVYQKSKIKSKIKLSHFSRHLGFFESFISQKKCKKEIKLPEFC